MSRRLRFSIFLVVACVGLTQKSPAPVVFREGEGVSTTAVDEEPVELKRNAAEQMQLAEATEAKGNIKRAISSYAVVVKRYPRAEVAARAQFKVAQLSEKAGDANKAFAEYQKLITKYPKSPDFEAAIEGQFNIAKLYLDGKRLEMFGVPTLPSMAKAEELFTTVITNAPFSAKYASAAQFNIGQARERQGEFPKAIEAYQKIIDDYPFSEMADDAQYQIGYVYMKASRAGEYDQSASIKAREAFEDFIYRYPNSEKVAQAKQNMQNLGAKQTDSAFSVAQFYDKQKNYKAAAIYYNEVIRTEPDSPNAKTSQDRLASLKAQVGEDKLTFAAPAETASKTKLKQKMQAQVDTTARPDFVGPVLPDAPPPPESAMRTSPDDIAPVPAVEPPLPAPGPAE
jgi:outer membrane protein assembly factor BamD